MNNDKRQSIGDMIRAAWERGEPAGWFEQIYAEADKGEGSVPWAHMNPNGELLIWAEDNNLSGNNQRAIVIGCGLGDDAEALVKMGFSVIAFDISPTAIEMCKRRFPDTQVDYQVADLFDMPDDWQNAFDFVFESRTIQALPVDLAPQTIAAMSALTAPGGRVLVLCHARDEGREPGGIPWPLSRADLAHFEANGLTQLSLEEFHDGLHRFRAVYQKPEAQ